MKPVEVAVPERREPDSGTVHRSRRQAEVTAAMPVFSELLAAAKSCDPARDLNEIVSRHAGSPYYEDLLHKARVLLVVQRRFHGHQGEDTTDL